MLETLSEKLQGVFQRLGRRGRLTEQDVDAALREVRMALLEADVNFQVVRGFIAKVRERAVGADVLRSLTPAQQVVKIVNEEIIVLLGGGQSKIEYASMPPTVVMLLGLQGSGKTTTAAKLALHVRKNSHRPLLVAADPYRPAAAAQLATLGNQLDIPVYQEDGAMPLQVARGALRRAREINADTVIIDTAGRLHIDEMKMDELTELRRELDPKELLLVADAMTGQDAVRAAGEFNKAVGLTGLVLTKMDGDARGGAALSIREVTGVPIKFIGTGEKVDALEPFYPDRLASRILGMGDVLSLIEKAEITVDEEKAKQLHKKMRDATFDLNDFLEQLQQVKKMGPLEQVMEMIPGFSALRNKLPKERLGADEKALKKTEAIIYSMTAPERHNPNLIDSSRRRRIARGSGTTVQDVNQLLNQFRQMQKMMKQLSRGGMRGLMSMMR